MEGVVMTVARPPDRDNEESPTVSPRVIRGIHAVRGLLLALAAFISAVTGLVLAMHRS
jgi:hypothetical protein